MNNSFIYTVDIVMPILILFVIVIMFKLMYNLGYPLHFKMVMMGFSKYSSFYKEGISFSTKKGTGYAIQKIKTKDFNNINLNLDIDIQNGNFSVCLLDKNKNSIINFQNENIKETLKVNINEIYYLKVKYREIKGKFDLTYKLS